MPDLAEPVTKYFTEHLPRNVGASSHTCASYARAFSLFLPFVSEKVGRDPSDLDIEHLSVPMILAFLTHLEEVRGNSVSTRNLRLAAIKSFFKYTGARIPACLFPAQQVRALESKKGPVPRVDYLREDEVRALLASVNTRRKAGVRDLAMLSFANYAGVRVSELLGLTRNSFESDWSVVQILGKGKRHRQLPVSREVRSSLDAWWNSSPRVPDGPIFLNQWGNPLTTTGVSQRLDVYSEAAAEVVPSILSKRVTPHTLRHTCAMRLLAATGNILKVSLWLGHASIKSTQPYLHQNLAEKIEMMSDDPPQELKKGTFGSRSDRVMAMLSEIQKG